MRSTQTLLSDGCDLMPCLSKEALSTDAKVLIEFELHQEASERMSTYRWRDISAP